MSDREPNSDDVITVEQFIALCYKCKLTSYDLEEMSVDMCFEYIEQWVSLHETKEAKAINATQSDFDAF